MRIYLYVLKILSKPSCVVSHILLFLQVFKDAAGPSEELQLVEHNIGGLDDLYLGIVSPPFQAYGEEIRKVCSFQSPKPQRHEDKKSYGIPSASLEILRSHTSKFGRVNEKKIEKQSNPLSTNHIIELAAVNFIQSNSGARDKLSDLSHPYASAVLGLSIAEDVQLVQDLLSCAEKVSNQHYVSASRLLAGCHDLSFSRTNVIKRLVYYFAEALCEKIDRETGRFTGKSMMKKSPLEPIKPTSALATFHQKMPLHQVSLFAGIQEVVDHVSSCKKVHIIDLEMRCGMQQVILMQALAALPESPLKHLKITAVAVDSNPMIEEAGVRLRSFAKSLSLSFSFQVIKLEDLLNFQLKLSHRDPNEKTAVYASHALKCMIAKPKQLEALMRVIRDINPCVMIVCEPEGNVNSPVFVNRFVEALFYYGAYFDCVEDCMKNAVAERTFVESNLFSPLLRTTVAAEGEERRSRIVGINVWRKFFAKFGMVEKELSILALDHANLVLKMFDCNDSCTLGLNGNSLIVRWKGTPIISLSAWKYQMLSLQNFRI